MHRLGTKLSSRLRSSPCEVELVRWRCYEFEKGEFVLFTDEELKAIAAESRQTIDIVSFHPRTIGRSPLLRQALLPRARQARRQAIQPAAAGDDGHGGAARWPSGRGGQRNTWYRCGPPRAAWCCSSCSTPTRCDVAAVRSGSEPRQRLLFRAGAADDVDPGQSPREPLKAFRPRWGCLR